MDPVPVLCSKQNSCTSSGSRAENRSVKKGHEKSSWFYSLVLRVFGQGNMFWKNGCYLQLNLFSLLLSDLEKVISFALTVLFLYFTEDNDCSPLRSVFPTYKA